MLFKTQNLSAEKNIFIFLLSSNIMYSSGGKLAKQATCDPRKNSKKSSNLT